MLADSAVEVRDLRKARLFDSLLRRRRGLIDELGKQRGVIIFLFSAVHKRFHNGTLMQLSVTRRRPPVTLMFHRARIRPARPRTQGTGILGLVIRTRYLPLNIVNVIGADLLLVFQCVCGKLVDFFASQRNVLR